MKYGNTEFGWNLIQINSDSDLPGIIFDLIPKKNPTISKMIRIKWYSIQKWFGICLDRFHPYA
jgi:hypothetical protein